MRRQYRAVIYTHTSAIVTVEATTRREADRLAQRLRRQTDGLCRGYGVEQWIEGFGWIVCD